MNTLRTHWHPAPLAACCLLVLTLSVAAPAAANHTFSYWQGPDEMIIPAWEFDYRQFSSTLTNTGNQPDSYTMTVTRQHPAEWSFYVVYPGTFSDTETVFTIPAFGTLPAGGEAIDIAFLVTSGDDGTALYTVHIVSNSNPSVYHTVTYSARTPTEDYDLLFSTGETIMVAEVDQFVQFHPVFYNAGTFEDTYLLTMVRDLPPNWTANFCMDGVCFEGAETSLIPHSGDMLWGGDAVPMEIDFETITDHGTGSVTVTIESLMNSSLVAEAAFTVSVPITSVQDLPSVLLSGVHAVPNPFNPRTEIHFEIGGELAHGVAVDILDVTGRLVQRLHSGLLQPGNHTVAWNGDTRSGQPAAAGVYLARVRAGQQTETIKLSLVK